MVHPTGNWAVWSSANMGQVGSDYGIEVESIRGSDGQTREWVRLWALLHVTDTTRLGNMSNTVHYLAGWSNVNDGSAAQFPGDPILTIRGQGACWFWPMLEYGDTRLSGPPPRYHPRPRWFWEPRGNATIVPGGINVHTISVQ